MATNISRKESLAEGELKIKQEQLAILESKLADCELEMATLKADLNRFWALYYKQVGCFYVALDEIETQIADAEARRLKRKDRRIRERETWTQWIRDKAEASRGSDEVPQASKLQPTDSLKKLFREVAKSVHPDLAVDQDERDLRQEFMAEANLAYQAGDEAKLRRILADWETRRQSVRGKGAATELVRVVRKIGQVEERLRAIEVEMIQLGASELYKLKVRVEEAEKEGRDLLTEMAADVRQRIADARRRLAEVIARRGRKVRVLRT